MRVLPSPLVLEAALSAVAQGQAGTAAVQAGDILTRLDLNSFPNSTGPRRRPTLHTPADYGLKMLRKREGGNAEVGERDGGWFMSARVLSRSAAGVVICFQDDGGGDAHYRATQVLRVSRGRDGLWFARPLGDRSGCRNDPPLIAKPLA